MLINVEIILIYGRWGNGVFLKEEAVFTNNQVIIDADCRKDNLIVLFKGSGENSIQLNGNVILKTSPGHRLIRFTKNHFCLLYNSQLSFYSFSGEFVSKHAVGPYIHELFPFQEGVLCIYGDEGVYGKGIGNTILIYASPFKSPKSFNELAIQYDLSYDVLFARNKPYACLNPVSNEILVINKKLEVEKTIEIPFNTENVIAFALTYNLGVFIEEKVLRGWNFETNLVQEHYGEFSKNTRAIYHRHHFMFINVSDHTIRVFKPNM